MFGFDSVTRIRLHRGYCFSWSMDMDTEAKRSMLCGVYYRANAKGYLTGFGSRKILRSTNDNKQSWQ